MNSFGSPNSLMIPSPEPQTIDSHYKTNFKQALNMEPSNHPVENWLKKLQEESWNLELLISGFSIFLLMQAGGVLKYAGKYIFEHFSFNSGAAFLIILIYILQLAVLLLTINLVIHIVLRGFWIGAIGLRSVQAKVDYEKLGYSDFFTQKLKKHITNLDDSLSKLDRLCSVVFSFTFLVVCMILSLFLTFALLGGLAYLVDTTSNMNETTFGMALYLFSVFLLVATLLGGLIYLIDTLSLGFFKKYTWLSKAYYPIYWFFGIVTMAGFYRAIYYHLISHFPKRKIQLFLLAYAVIPILLPFHKIDYYQFISDQDSKEKLTMDAYDDQRAEEDWIEKASIPSQLIKESFLPLFIRYNVQDNEDIIKLCDDYTPTKNSGFISGIYVGKEGLRMSDPLKQETDPAKLRDCLARFYTISVDDSLYTEQEYFYYTHSNQGEKGLYTVLDIKGLSRGQHKISIQTKIFNTKDELVKEDYIIFPFWFDHK